MGEIVKLSNEEIELYSGIELDADKIPIDDLKKLFSDLNGIYGIGKAIKDSIESGEYVLKIPKDIQEGLDSGIYWFCDKKDGSGTLPDIWGFNEEGKKAIKERLVIDKKISVDGVNEALQNYAQQQQMAKITEELKEIHEEIKKIEKGQTDDRFAMVEAAYEHLKYASATDNEALRSTMIGSALSMLAEGRARILRVMTSKIEHFRKIPQSKAGIRVKMFFDYGYYYERKEEEAKEILKYFEYYEKSIILSAYSFSILNEQNLVQEVIKTYEDTLLQLNTENLATYQYLRPDLDFSDEWFVDKINHSKKMERKVELMELKNNKYINLRIEGNLLQEVI